MKIKDQGITTKDILEHWGQNKSTLDWRSLTIKGKGEWLKACLSWSGLPNEKIRSFNYMMDANQVNSVLDFYCLLGEVFFGYRGYFGQDSQGFRSLNSWGVIGEEFIQNEKERFKPCDSLLRCSLSITYH